MNNKTEKAVRKHVVRTVGKVLTLCGVALTFAACYGTPHPDWTKEETADIEEKLYGTVDETPTAVQDAAETAETE